LKATPYPAVSLEVIMCLLAKHKSLCFLLSWGSPVTDRDTQKEKKKNQKKKEEEIRRRRNKWSLYPKDTICNWIE
jgi:hypothetical protein